MRRRWTREFLLFSFWAVFLALCAVRLRTVVTGQDPDIYLLLARRILALPPGSPEFQESLFYVAPGFPLILSGLLAGFGPFAVWWVNLPFLFLLLLSLHGILRHMLRDPRELPMAMLAIGVILFLGRPQNLWHWVYPFREASASALGLLALWVLVRPGSMNRAGPLLGAGCLLVASASIRETMLVLWGPAMAWVWTKTRPRSARALLLLSAPLLVAVSLAAGFIAVGGNPVMQWQRFMARLHIGPWSALPAALWSRLRWSAMSHGGMLAQQATTAGLALMALGLWRNRRNDAVWFFLLLPAGLLFALYALFPPHWRYMQAILLFLAPLAGLGLLEVTAFVASRLQPFYRRAPARLLNGVVCVLLGALLLAHAARVPPSGPGVTRGEVSRLLSRMQSFAEPGDAFYTERGCRWLHNAVAMYAPLRIDLHLPDLPAHWEAGRRAFFLRPLDASAYHRTPGTGQTAAQESRIRHRMNLVPETGQKEEPRIIEFAGARFEVFRMEPWTRRTVNVSVATPRGLAVVVWMDLHGVDPIVPKQIRALDAAGRELGAWQLAQGNGLLAIRLPPAMTEGRRVIFEVASSTPLPDQLRTRVLPEGEPARFSYRFNRSVSLDQLIGALPPEIEEPGTAPEPGPLGVRIDPPPVLGDAGELELLFVLDAAHRHADAPAAEFVNRLAGRELSRHPIDWGRLRQWNSFVVPLDGSGNTEPVSIAVEEVSAQEARLRIHEVRMWVRPPSDSLLVPDH